MNAQHAWDVAYSQLQLQLDRTKFDTWLRGAVLLGVEEGVFVVGVRNVYAAEMLQQRLYRNVRRVLSDVINAPVELRFEVYRPAPKPLEQDDMPLFQALAQQESPSLDTRRPMRQLLERPQHPDVPESELNPQYTFARYIAGNANNMAYQAALAVVDSPGRNYNPFMVYSDSGLGKSHLLQAIAHACLSRNLRAVYIPSEAFVNDMVTAIRAKTMAMFRDKYRSVDVLLVDDVQFIAGKDGMQEEFFHTFNALYAFNKQIVLASDRHPRELATLEDRLRSRFEGGLVVDIPPLEYEARVALVQMWAQEQGLRLPYGVVDAVAQYAQRNVRELLGAFNHVVANLRHGNQPMTPAALQVMLNRYEAPRLHGSKLTPGDVINATAAYYQIRPQELTGKARTQRVNQARQIAMFLIRDLLNLSLPQIGEVLGGRSHTTVLHGCNRVCELIASDERVARQIDDIRRALAGN